VILVHYFRLIRPENVLLTFISVWLAAFISPKFEFTYSILWAALSASMILAGANIINDIYDLEIDKLNRPERMIASGRISVQSAWMLFYFTYFIGFIFAWLTGASFFLIAVCMAILMVWYSSYLKRTILLGNLLVSFVAGITFIYGAMAIHDWKVGIIPAVFAFCYHLGREIIKDIQDMPGDLKNNVITFPGKHGIRSAIRLVNLIFIVLIILTLLPYIFSVYESAYFWLVIFGVDVVLIAVMFILHFRQDPKTLAILSLVLKIDMFVGLVSVWIGSHNVVFFN